MKHAAKRAATVAILLAAGTAQADWHSGRITQIGTAYDGSTIAFHIEGWSRTNCACYANWPDAMCLDRARTSFKEDMAMLLSARARGTAIMANIDETTCKVVALYEVD